MTKHVWIMVSLCMFWLELHKNDACFFLNSQVHLYIRETSKIIFYKILRGPHIPEGTSKVRAWAIVCVIFQVSDNQSISPSSPEASIFKIVPNENITSGRSNGLPNFITVSKSIFMLSRNHIKCAWLYDIPFWFCKKKIKPWDIRQQ